MAVCVYEKDIMVDGRIVYKAPSRIQEAVFLGERIVVVYSAHEILPRGSFPPDNWPRLTDDQIQKASRNVLMLDLEGNIIWRIEPWVPSGERDWSHGYGGLLQIPKENIWRIYNRKGWSMTIDINTGSLSNLQQG